VEGKVTAHKSRSKSAHLMCGSKTWTIVAFLSCAYFARVAIARLAAGGLPWSHDTVDIATHIVWMVFLVGLLTETRCWKEWVFFSLVLLNFGIASVLGIWNSAPASVLIRSRELSAATWGLAALLSLVLIFMPGERRASEETGNP
jgi:hypothetical protein